MTANLAAGGIGGPAPHKSGKPGEGIGGGIFQKDASLSLDSFTILNLTQNFASTSSPNIAGGSKKLR